MLHAIDIMIRVSLAVILPFMFVAVIYTALDAFQRKEEN
jgi:hypothetical protein